MIRWTTRDHLSPLERLAARWHDLSPEVREFIVALPVALGLLVAWYLLFVLMLVSQPLPPPPVAP